MKITQIVGLVNTKLAGETLTYNQMLSFLDDTINDINTNLNACFPTFSEVTTVVQADSVYDAIPDQYITSVVVIGAAYKFYTTDEEGLNVATGYQQEYERGLFYMVRDYSASVPEKYQAQNRGYVEGPAPSLNLADPLACRSTMLNPDLRPMEGPRGLPGPKGDKGDPGYTPRKGIDYFDGPPGPQGPQGPQGPRGITGATGPKGAAGAQGLPGPKGAKGERGPQGPQGDPGYTPQKGVDYFTPKDIAELGISKIKEGLGTVEAIAKGRATGYVFDTVADLDLWLLVESNVSNLVLGDNFYIREIDVPDYWWDGTEKQQLETQKVDLSDYYTKTEAGEQAWDAAAAYDDIVLGDKFAAKADVRSHVNIENDENYIHFGTLGLSDNTEYVASEPISTLHLMYPETDFICSIYFTLASSGTITITLPESKYIGDVPNFKNGETWELSIKNGVVVGGKVV